MPATKTKTDKQRMLALVEEHGTPLLIIDHDEINPLEFLFAFVDPLVYSITAKEQTSRFWMERMDVVNIDVYRSISAFPAYVHTDPINRPEKIFRFDDPTIDFSKYLSVGMIFELDPEKDRHIIEKLYPRFRIESDLEILQERLKGYVELKRKLKAAYPMIGTAANSSDALCNDYYALCHSIRLTETLISMAERGLEYYDRRN